jgi:hypothetical protein
MKPEVVYKNLKKYKMILKPNLETLANYKKFLKNLYLILKKNLNPEDKNLIK